MCCETCNKCRKKVQSFNTYLKCSICSATYHITCVHLDKDDRVDEVIWYCPPCIQCILPFNHADDDDVFIQTVIEAVKGSTRSTPRPLYLLKSTMIVHFMKETITCSPIQIITTFKAHHVIIILKTLLMINLAKRVIWMTAFHFFTKTSKVCLNTKMNYKFIWTPWTAIYPSLVLLKLG